MISLQKFLNHTIKIPVSYTHLDVYKRQAIKETSNIEITISRDGYFTQSGGYEVMKQILLETKDIDVLFCHNDDMALGAIKDVYKRQMYSQG